MLPPPAGEDVWIVGDGRSGTTWVAELINSKNSYNYLFEPFHPHFVQAVREYPFFPYVAPGGVDERLLAFYTSVFKGERICKRVNRDEGGAARRRSLVKDIHAHLFMGAIQERFPSLRTVLLIRDPSAVAASKLRLTNGVWCKDLDSFLSQPALMRDHLEPFRLALEAPATEFERYVAVWTLIHYVAFRTVDLERTHIVVYERFRQRPDEEVRALFDFLRPGADNTELVERGLAQFDRPSRTTYAGSRRGERPADGGVVDRDGADERVREILSAFHLEELYRDARPPSSESLSELIGRLRT